MTFRDFYLFMPRLDGVSEASQYVYALTLYSQAVHETGNFTSNLAKKNNLFGMKKASKRPQEGVTGYDQNGHCYYISVRASIVDRVNRDKQFGIMPPYVWADVRSYCQQVAQSGYATDGAYLQKWVTIINQYISLWHSGNNPSFFGNFGKFFPYAENVPSSLGSNYSPAPVVSSASGGRIFGISIITLLGAVGVFLFFKIRKKIN